MPGTRACASIRRRGGHLSQSARQGAFGFEALADDLKLQLPSLPWHTQRDRIAEVAACFGMLIGTFGR